MWRVCDAWRVCVRVADSCLCDTSCVRVVCKLFMTRGSEFAFEASATRLAWRRWPPAGTPAWVAVNERHEAALQWCGGPYASLQETLEELERDAEEDLDGW